MFNIVVNPQDISTIQNTISTNPTPAMKEDAYNRYDKDMQNLLNIEFKWKICICIYAKNGK